MRTRRSVLVGVGGLIALAGCSQQSSQPSEDESDTEGATGEFAVEQFRVGGERPDEYEAEFIAGSSPEEVADELTPEVNYQISGASGEVETEVHYAYTEETIPEDEPLDETVEGDTHEGSGEYTQAPSMPDELVSEIVENPKNLHVTFKATDTESEGEVSREYELNFADSYIEQIQRELFTNSQMVVSEADLQNITVGDGVIDVEFDSNYEIGTQKFNNQIANFNGLYTSNVSRSRIPYEVDIIVNDTNGDTYDKHVVGNKANSYLRGDMTEDEFSNSVLFNQLWTKMDQN